MQPSEDVFSFVRKSGGVLPLNLIELTNKFVSVELKVPAELRGVELTAEDIETLNPKLVEYKVSAKTYLDKDYSVTKPEIFIISSGKSTNKNGNQFSVWQQQKSEKVPVISVSVKADLNRRQTVFISTAKTITVTESLTDLSSYCENTTISLILDLNRNTGS